MAILTSPNITQTDRRYAEAAQVVAKLQKNGFAAYFVGGCVRDLFLGYEPKDYDVATAAKPEDVRRIFPGSKGFGARFGVSEVATPAGIVEVAAFREDGFYFDHRRPAWVNYANLEADSRRRDFTINALYYDPIADQTVDLVDGLADLQERLLRLIGDPFERFDEDWLRMLRAVRFAARFALRIDPLTFDALHSLAALVTGVTPERRTEEIRLMLTGPNPGRAVGLLYQCGLWRALLPELPFITERVRKAVNQLRKCQVVPPDTTDQKAEAPDASVNIWAAFFVEVPEEIIKQSCRELRLTRAEKRRIHLE